MCFGIELKHPQEDRELRLPALVAGRREDFGLNKSKPMRGEGFLREEASTGEMGKKSTDQVRSGLARRARRVSACFGRKMKPFGRRSGFGQAKSQNMG